jgi:hypothetical protein
LFLLWCQPLQVLGCGPVVLPSTGIPFLEGGSWYVKDVGRVSNAGDLPGSQGFNSRLDAFFLAVGTLAWWLLECGLGRFGFGLTGRHG